MTMEDWKVDPTGDQTPQGKPLHFFALAFLPKTETSLPVEGWTVLGRQHHRFVFRRYLDRHCIPVGGRRVVQDIPGHISAFCCPEE